MVMVVTSTQTKCSVAFGKMDGCMVKEHFNLRKMLKNGNAMHGYETAQNKFK